MTTVEFLSYLRMLDVKLWAESDQLHYSAPKGAVTKAMRAELSERKAEIIEFLHQSYAAKCAEFPLIQTAPHSETLALSFAQERLWFFSSVGPDSFVHNISRAIWLRGVVNETALEQGLNEIIRRHEILRTNFARKNVKPSQRIIARRTVNLPIIDLRKVPEATRESEMYRLFSAEGRRSFNLSEDLLIRAMLYRLDTEDQVLLIVMSHLVSDGWSMGVFLRELMSHYRSYSSECSSPPPDLPIQYKDFAFSQRQWVKTRELETQRSYWKRQLEGAPLALTFTTNHQHKSARPISCKTQNYNVPRPLTESLKRLGQREGATLFMTLLAAFDVLLHRYTGEVDILVGSDIANRNHVETEDLIGFFANVIVLRTDLSGNPTFRDVLRRVVKTTLGAYAHQDLPFEELINTLQPKRDLACNPLFRIAFVLQNIPTISEAPPGLSVSFLAIEGGATQYDLALSMEEHENGLAGTWHYQAYVFDEATIERMAEHFRNLLESIVVNPRQHLSELSFMSSVERRKLLFDWSGAKDKFFQYDCLHGLFEKQVTETPSAVAVEFKKQQITYWDLNKKANEIGRHLQALGVGPDSLVGVCLEPSLEMIVALLGVLKAGGAYVPLDPEYPARRLSFMISDSKVDVLLTTQNLRKRVLDCKAHIVCFDTNVSLGACVSDDYLSVNIDRENLAYVIYTSGSTGTPKGVMNTHLGICNRLLWMQDTYRLTPDDRVLQKTPFSFDVSVWEFFWPLSSGARVVILEPGGHNDSPYLINVIREQKITTVHFVPSMLNIFLKEESLELCNTSLRRVFCSGEELPFELQTRFFAQLQAELHNLYGPTEAAVDVTSWRCRRDSTEGPVPIGRPITNTQTYILDSELQPVPTGVPGELYVGGVCLARGYLNRPDLTAESFLPNPYSKEPGARLYKTGDRVRYRSEGSIEFLDRLDYQTKIRGFRIELGEIESVLMQHPKVGEAVVIAHDKEGITKQLAGYVVADDKALTPKELQQYLEERLPYYMVPAAFVLLDMLPLSPNGKVDRRALPVPTEDDLLVSHFVSPRNGTEKALAELWAEVLGVDRIGIHDNFLDLGGDSLLAMGVISRVRSKLGVEPTVQEFFEAATVAELSAAWKGLTRAETRTHIPRIDARRGRINTPLSFAQQRLWFLDQLDEGTAAYNISFSIRLTGAVDASVLKQAVEDIGRRHEVLSTHFEIVNDTPVQVIEPTRVLTLAEVDLQWIPGAEQSLALKRLSMAEAGKSFSLKNGPLIRITLYRLDRKSHVLLVTMHHIVSDGWSIGIFVRELSVLYNAIDKGVPSTLPELSIQYTDYAQWQRQWLTGHELEAQLGYWKQQLAGAPLVLDLPTDRPRPPIQTLRGGTKYLKLSVELKKRLRTLCDNSNTTLFMTLVAAFAILLSRYSNQEEIVVGSPVANRNQRDVEPLIGLFVNTVLLRVDLKGQPSCAEVLRRVRETALDAYSHQGLPFEKLVEEFQPERSLSHTPLFQVMIALQNAPMERWEIPGVEFSPVKIERKTSRFDLTLSVEESEQGLEAAWEYNSDLFEVSTIERMARQWQAILEGMVANPERQVADLPLLTPGERDQLLVKWNDTRSDFPDEACLHQLFEAQAERNPDATAAVFEKGSITYLELNQRANQVAHHLRSLGVGAETLVGICLDRSLEMLIGLLGILKAGGAYVPIDPTYPGERVSFMLEDAGVEMLVTQQQVSPRVSESVGKRVVLDSGWESIARECESNPARETAPDNLAYVIYTSGSTGKPKGVQISHRAVVNFLSAMGRELKMNEQDVVLATTTLSFDIAVLELFLPLTMGARIEMVQREVASSGTQLLEKLTASGATVMQAAPVTWRLLLQAGWQGNEQLRVLCGGEPLLRELADDLRARGAALWNLYGPTETTVWSSAYRVEREDGPVPIGRPIANTQLYILNSRLEPVPIGVAGELHIGGEGLARGYLNRPELTAEKFIPDPFSRKPGSCLYRTGDRARYLPDGNIEFLGRLDNQVKIRGIRVELGEIESALAEHPDVLEAVVIAREEHTGSNILAAYLVPNRSITTTELRRFLLRNLPEHMIPSTFVVLEELPLTPNGKIDRRVLPEPNNLRPTLDVDYMVPQSETERIISDVWQEHLGIKKVGVNDNFFDLGGHSLLLAQVNSRLQAVLGVRVSMVEMFQYPTIKSLAMLLSQRESIEPDSHPCDTRAPVRKSRKMSIGEQKRKRQKHRSLESDRGLKND